MKVKKNQKEAKRKEKDANIKKVSDLIDSLQKEPKKASISKNNVNDNDDDDGFKRTLKGNHGPLVKHREGEKWYTYQIEETVNNEDESKNMDLNKYLKEGEEILSEDSKAARIKDQQNGAESSWLYSAISNGTSTDKRTAMQLLMHKSPVHSLEYIKKLLDIYKRQGSRDIMDVLPILEDVFVNYILPENRKLLPLSKRPLHMLTKLSSGNERTRRKILMLWTFEHNVKILYQKFIETSSEIIKRPLEELSRKVLKTISICLSERPESEQLLLSTLVNSFGHPNYKIGSFVVYLMEEISRKHPAMRIIIVQEIERLVFRKNVNEKAHVYSITYLSQIHFSKKDSELAGRLMSIYVPLFKTIVNKKIQDSRLLPIILAGANRAFPFSQNLDSLVNDINDVFYLCHNTNFRVAIPALKLIYQFHKSNNSLSDRYYNALYKKLLDNCPPAAYAQFLKLIYESMKEDPSTQRVRAFIKRLLQICVNANPEYAASILLLVSRVKSSRSSENIVVLSKSANPTVNIQDDEDDEQYFDHDVNGEVINNVAKIEPKVETDNVNENEDTKSNMAKSNVFQKTAGWVHSKLNPMRAKSSYDMDARNALYVNADEVADNELHLLSKHYHPSVVVFAQSLLANHPIKYDGDSLQDFSLMNFLDRFAFRNPKEVSKTDTRTRITRKKVHDPWGIRKLSVKSKEYTNKKTEEIPADERFLHKYTSTMLKGSVKQEEKDEDDDWEYADSVASDEFDQIMEKFEPGELNEEFDIDYSKEFSSEKGNRNQKTKEADLEVDEDDYDIDEDEIDYDNEEEDDDDDADDDGNDSDDEDEDSDDEEDDDDEDDADDSMKNGSNMFNGYSESSDEENDDYEVAGDRFAEMLEDFNDEDDFNKKKNKKTGSKRKGSSYQPKKGGKKRRN